MIPYIFKSNMSKFTEKHYGKQRWNVDVAEGEWLKSINMSVRGAVTSET